MNKLYSAFILLLISMSSQGQEFLWAHSYQISNCNEVGGLAVDSSENIILSGVHEGPVNVPYKGDIYILKTNNEGSEIWTFNISGELIFGDIIAMNNDIIIAGQAYGSFTYKEEQYGGAGFYLFVVKLDNNGDLLWIYTDEGKNGSYAANLSADNESDNFVLHTRAQTNLGDWIMIFDPDGNVLNSRLLSPTQTLIVDAAYYDGNVYLNGEINGFSGVVIDTLFIPQSPLESTFFVLALDSALTGKWVSIDTTLNNGDGTLEANHNGVYVYGETLQPPFNIVHNLKRFTFAGDLINEIIVPAFNATAILFPSMTLVDNRLAMFLKNSFGTDNFKVLIFDKNLQLLDEKIVTGQMDQYSNQIDAQGDDLIISHVHQSTLNLNDEITLPYEGSGKLPYIAKLGEAQTTDIFSVNNQDQNIVIYPNPAEDEIQIQSNEAGVYPGTVEILDYSGRSVFISSNSQAIFKADVSHLPAGMYLIKSRLSNGKICNNKLLIH